MFFFFMQLNVTQIIMKQGILKLHLKVLESQREVVGKIVQQYVSENATQTAVCIVSEQPGSGIAASDFILGTWALQKDGQRESDSQQMTSHTQVSNPKQPTHYNSWPNP